MITKFKIYEEINKGWPEIGDYVISNLEITVDPEMKKLNNLIGQIYNTADKLEKTDYNFYVKYTIPYDLSIDKYIFSQFGTFINKNNLDYNINLASREILYWSKDKEELEMCLDTKIFNL